MLESSEEHNRLYAMMNSLGFTGDWNPFISPVTYEVKQWYGHDQDVQEVEALLEEIGEIE